MSHPWGPRRVVGRKQRCLAIVNRARLDDSLLNFGFKRLPYWEPVLLHQPEAMIFKTPKYAKPVGKTKKRKLNRVTKKDYKLASAENVDASLNKMFKRRVS